MDKHWVIDKIEKLEIKDKNNDIVVVSFNPENINVTDASLIFEQIEKKFQRLFLIMKIN